MDLALRGGEGDGSLGGADQERERFGEIEVDAAVIVAGITDGQVLAKVEFVVSAAGRQQDGALRLVTPASDSRKSPGPSPPR